MLTMITLYSSDEQTKIIYIYIFKYFQDTVKTTHSTIMYTPTLIFFYVEKPSQL